MQRNPATRRALETTIYDGASTRGRKLLVDEMGGPLPETTDRSSRRMDA